MNQSGYGGAHSAAGEEVSETEPGPQITTPLAPYAQTVPPVDNREPSGTGWERRGPHYAHSHHGPHRLPAVGPVLLIGAGVLFLLNNLGIVDWSIWEAVLRLWPLALILLGIDMIIGRRNPLLSVLLTAGVVSAGIAFLLSVGGIAGRSDIRQEVLDVPAGDARAASVTMQIGMGDLMIGAGEGPSLASGTIEYSGRTALPKPQVTINAGEASLQLRQPSSRWSFFGSGGHTAWRVDLSKRLPLRLNVQSGAGTTTLDLEQLDVSELELNTGAGAAAVTFPAGAGHTAASIDGGAGGITITIPEGVGALIKVDTGIGNVNVDSHFARTANSETDTYVSSDYATAANKLDLSINVGVGSLDIVSGPR